MKRTILYAAAALLLVHPLMTVLRVDPAAWAETRTYLLVVCAGLVGSIGYNLNAGILGGMGNSSTTLLFLAVSTILNIFLDLALVLAVPLGVLGVALGTVIAQLCSWLFGIWYINRRYPQLAIHPFNGIFDRKLFCEIIRIGLPSGIQMSLVALGAMGVLSKINSYGKAFTAGFNVGNKLDTLFLHMTDGVVAFDREGHLIHCNPAATELLRRSIDPSCTYEELLGDLHPFQNVLALQKPNYIEDELVVGDRTLALYLTPFSDKAQGGVLILLHDVTEQHRNEERRKEFVANVSHELRTPLTNVRSYAETIRDAGDDIPRDMENNFLDIIITETDRMTHIVQDLLTLSRLDAGSTEMVFTRFPFHDAIESVVRSNSLNAKQRGHELTYVPEGELPLITGDRSRLEQVMMNILGNAIKYTPDGGHIRVTAGAGPDTAWMEVRDDGIGIPEKDRERIFDRFYRVDKARSRESGGTGLGLSIAKEIVELHGGTIRADSTEDRITFTICLPSDHSEAP